MGEVCGGDLHCGDPQFTAGTRRQAGTRLVTFALVLDKHIKPQLPRAQHKHIKEVRPAPFTYCMLICWAWDVTLLYSKVRVMGPSRQINHVASPLIGTRPSHLTLSYCKPRVVPAAPPPPARCARGPGTLPHTVARARWGAMPASRPRAPRSARVRRFLRGPPPRARRKPPKRGVGW